MQRAGALRLQKDVPPPASHLPRPVCPVSPCSQDALLGNGGPTRF